MGIELFLLALGFTFSITAMFGSPDPDSARGGGGHANLRALFKSANGAVVSS